MSTKDQNGILNCFLSQLRQIDLRRGDLTSGLASPLLVRLQNLCGESCRLHGEGYKAYYTSDK